MKNNLLEVAMALLCFSIRTSHQQYFPSLILGALKVLREGLQYTNNEPMDQPTILNEYDFIVIGAGSAGNVIANRLTEVPDWKVLLIEAGQEETFAMDIPLFAEMLQFTDANWKYKTVPSNKYCLGMNNHQCNFPRGKVMGGSSVLNLMIYTRGHWKDFDNWANLGNSGWDYENVLEYFKKLEDLQIPKYSSNTVYRGTGGYQTISESPFRSKGVQAFVNGGAEMGYPIPDDVNARYQVGFSYHQLTIRNGTRCSTSRAYLHPIRERSNLHVKKRSTVTKILINAETKTALGVEFQRKGRKRRVLARKEVIVSAGAINSPQLLMLSGIGPRKHLEQKGIRVVQDLPVGENLMDHVALGGLSFLASETESFGLKNVLINPHYLNDFFYYHKGPLSVPEATEALAYFDHEHLENPDGHPDLELLFINGLLNTEEFVWKGFGITQEVYNKILKPAEGLSGFTIFPMAMRPKSKGRVLLADADPFHHPLIYPNYFADERDLDVLVKGVRISQKLLKTESMRRLKATQLKTQLLGCANYTYDSDDYWKCHARNLPFTIYHLSGTCKMAPVTDPSGVVDPRLKVRGIRNLRVADASIMPEITSAHTNAPTIMIGEKASDLIKQDWGVKT